MGARLVEAPFAGTLADALPARPSSTLQIWWLGQAGFVIDLCDTRLVIDPYLSDSLARKYAGTARLHRRMMPPPIEPGTLTGVDAVLVTHAHGDHADPGTLPALLAANPAARLIAPAAVAGIVLERAAIDVGRLVLVNAGEAVDLAPALTLVPTRAAHETLKTDTRGRHCFLGYVVRAERDCLWHSGDCVPFEGLAEEVAALRPEIVLLPVNGRSAALRSAGIAGNFTLAEAIDVAARVGAASLVAHHYGMFDFNTADPAGIDRKAADIAAPTIFRAKAGVALRRAQVDAGRRPQYGCEA